jgi:hypothetical protein
LLPFIDGRSGKGKKWADECDSLVVASGWRRVSERNERNEKNSVAGFVEVGYYLHNVVLSPTPCSSNLHLGDVRELRAFEFKGDGKLR